jgi:hypothetical protein
MVVSSRGSVFARASAINPLTKKGWRPQNLRSHNDQNFGYCVPRSLFACPFFNHGRIEV